MAKITIGGMTIEVTIDEMIEYGKRIDELNGVTKEPAEEVAEEPLKVGDYAIVHETSLIKYLKDGMLVKITDADGMDGFWVEEVGGESTAWLYVYELVKATEEEVAAALGKPSTTQTPRKPGEFKVGDIFRTPNGNAVYEVTRIATEDEFPVKFLNRDGVEDGYHRNASITLVAHVESRVDL